MFAIVIFAILPLKLMSSPSVSLEATHNTTVMVSPVQTPADEGSHEGDLISLLQKTLSKVTAGDQSKDALEKLAASDVFVQQKREAHAHTVVAIRQVDGSIIIGILCVAICIAVAFSGIIIYIVHEVQKHMESLMIQNAKKKAKGLLPKDYAAESSGDTIDYQKSGQNGKKALYPGAESTIEDSVSEDSFSLEKKLLHAGGDSTSEEASSETTSIYSNKYDSVPLGIVAFAPECRAGGHPDFSGTWKCIKIEGAIHSYLKDLGFGYFGRRAFTAWGCGAGQVIRHYTHTGHHVKLYEKGLAEEVQEWDIADKEQEIKTDTPFLQTAYWDKENPLILVLEAKDIEKKRPETWTTTRQFFIDSRTFALQTTTPGGHTCRWVYERFDEADQIQRL